MSRSTSRFCHSDGHCLNHTVSPVAVRLPADDPESALFILESLACLPYFSPLSPPTPDPPIFAIEIPKGHRRDVRTLGRNVHVFPLPEGPTALGKGWVPVPQAPCVLDRRLLRPHRVHRELVDGRTKADLLDTRILLSSGVRYAV